MRKLRLCSIVAAPATVNLRLRILALSIAIGLTALTATAQKCAIDWFTTDGGGGTSSGGAYFISGTIGQPDAGPVLSGGNYTLTGGFWSVVEAVQTPGAPLLVITRDFVSGAITVSWDAPATGFILQRTTTLAGVPSAPWTVVTSPYSTNAGKIFITEAAPVSDSFYRLQKP